MTELYFILKPRDNVEEVPAMVDIQQGLKEIMYVTFDLYLSKNYDISSKDIIFMSLFNEKDRVVQLGIYTDKLKEGHINNIFNKICLKYSSKFNVIETEHISESFKNQEA